MKKIFLFILLFIVSNCSINKVSKHHGIYFLENKHKELVVLESNKNDIIKLLGPPSTTGSFNNDLWIYLEVEKTNKSIYTLSEKRIIKNNVLILEIDERGLLAKKNFFDINDMNKLKFSENSTSNIYSKNSFVYQFLSSMRQRLNDPLGQRKKAN